MGIGSKGRAFVMGNGPSLAWTPMDKLIHETTFAMNRINLLYSVTSWRPTYYLALDWTGPNIIDDVIVNTKVAKHSFIRADRASDVELRRQVLDWPPKITYLWPCRHHIGINAESPNRPMDWHIPGICAYGSTIGAAIQMAVMFGHGPIYLLGCDLGFKSFEQGSPDPNHFDPNYIGHDDFPLEKRDETLKHMHSIAEKASPVRIFNATLGGLLEEHERIDLGKVF